MSGCEQLTANASAGVAPALRAVDCLANETTAAAFGRLFGGNGALVPALTILLTLYIAFFAVSLLTGRSRLGLSALTPRMITLGLVLTFATSWIAYQSVVWNLAIGAPDQIASVLTGSRGSATQIFADRIDMIFAAIAEVAGGTPSEGAQGASQAASQGSFTPGNLMWLGALLLLLGTVGVLVTSRIALAVLLALGPVFVVLAIFPGTRGLFVGWLRGVVMTAVTPLFVVLGGSLVLELLVPVVSALRGADGIDARASLALFMIAAVHVALMAMVLKVSGAIVGGWQVFGLAGSAGAGDTIRAPDSSPAAGVSVSQIPALTPRSTARLGPLASAMTVTTADSPGQGGSSVSTPSASRTHITHVHGGEAVRPAAALPRQRARGIGSRFRAPPARLREIAR